MNTVLPPSYSPALAGETEEVEKGGNTGKGVVVLSADFPGGNVKICRLVPGVAEIEADLRDTPSPWFYWNFEARAKKAGTVKFLFPVDQMQISAQGPAVSTDGGRTWHWLGKEQTRFLFNEPDGHRDSFSWTFQKAGETIRFAQGFPYQKADLEFFLRKYENHPDLKRAVLTKTRKGSDCPLLIIGNGPLNVYISARHHACEATASYTLEGFLEEALSNTPSGKSFREKYTLYAVPFVDLDGVESGDQGKGRSPYDHNRDYGAEHPIYPEVQAVMKLNQDKKFCIMLDLHDPFVRGGLHEECYFAGYRTPSSHENIQEWIHWLDLEAPCAVQRTLDLQYTQFLNPVENGGYPFAQYFSGCPTTVFAATMEISYAQQCIDFDGDAARKYGQALLRSMMHVDFTKDPEPRTAFADFQKFSASFGGNP